MKYRGSSLRHQAWLSSSARSKAFAERKEKRVSPTRPNRMTPPKAAKTMAEISNEYSAENPLYIVALGAITNVASAALLNPKMKERVVIERQRQIHVFQNCSHKNSRL